MKTKKEKLLINQYEKFIDLGLGDFPLDRINEIAVKDVMGYGTTIDEKIFQIDGVQELVIKQKEQGKGAEINYTIERVFQKMFSNDEAALFVDEFQINMIIDGMTHVIPVRVSTVLEFIDNNWKVIHWHGSVAVESEDDTWHINEWKQKNEKLQRLVDEQTLDLVNKNHELEIESSLERVRTVAMGMNKSEDLLSICEASFKEFKKLGFDNLRNAVIHIPNDEQKYLMDYDYSEHTGGDIAKIKYGSHHIVDEYMEKIRSTEDAYFEVVISKDQLNGWREFRKNSGQSDDSRLDKADALYYYLFSIGIGDIGISTFKPIEDSQIKILKRFRNVFDLAYKRYNDITLAEAQAREAQIEAALERVRARSMAMHNSSELVEASDVMFDQMKKLGIESLRIGIGTINEKDRNVEIWSRSEIKGKVENKIVGVVPFGVHPVFDGMVEAWRAKKKYFASERVGDEVKDYYKRLSKFLSYPLPKKYNKRESVTTFFFNTGSLNVISLYPLKQEECDIMIRFAKVFEQTYTRFLDLQKAEAQAREAQIEAALERIRSRAMGMQKSEEVGDVSDILFSEFNKLNLKVSGCSIIVIDEEEDKMELWRARSNVAVKPFERSSFNKSMKILKKHMPDFYKKFFNALEKRENYLIVEFEGAKYLKYINVISDIFNYSKAEKSKLLKNVSGKMVAHYIFTKLGYLALTSEKELSEENLSIAKRFIESFDFAYTRFLDIKNAEEREREAEIQLALERVRSRSMAMHKSEELADLSLVLVKQVQALGVATWFCAFNIYDDDPQGSLEWGSNGEGTFPQYRTPRDGIFLRYYEASERGEILLINEIGEDECPAHYDYLCTLPGVGEQLLKMKDSGIPFPTSQIDHVAYFKYGYIIFITYEPVEESHDIFKRFAKVFEQTYTRFLDLQKAENQAREAQIETALEKIRSRTMAMQSSDELPEAANLLFLEVQALGIPTWSAGYNILSTDKKTAECWMSSEGAIQPSFTLYFKKEKSFIEQHKFFKSDEKFMVQELSGKALEKHYDYMKAIPKIGDIIIGLERSGFSLPTSQINHLCKFEQGYLLFITYEAVPEAHELFIRFTKVFEQTYTRFLDLQKAEAQARETEIQLALEKVRMVALGLNKSEEMLKVAKALYEELIKLGFPNVRNAIIDINNGDDDTFTDYDYSHDMSGTITQMSYHDDPTLEGQFKKMATTTNDFFELVLEGKELEDLIAMRIKNGEDEDPRLLNTKILTYNLYSFGNGAIGISNFGLLNEEEKTILNRFSNVFTFAYKRYNDLATAEAQAREAQIEAALERIRGQVTAMQESNELLDIVVKMRTEFVSLGHEAHYFWYMRYLPEIYEKAMTSGDGTKIGMIMTLPRHIHGDIKLLADWEKSNEPTVVFAMDVDTALEYVDKMITLGNFVQVDPNAPTLDDIRYIGGLTFVMARTHQGEIGFSLPGTVPNPPQESLDTLVRFAGVFDLAYSRFEDLKDAEKRNRETQIELALERVRARTMAMQKSSELARTAANLFEQMETLGIKPYRCNIAIVDAKHKKLKLWSTTNHGNVIPVGSDIPLNENSVFKELYNGWKKQKKNHSIKLVGENRVNWTKYISKYVPFDEYKPKKFSKSKLMKETAIFNNFYFRQGYFVIHTKEDISDEDFDIIQRFANVFEQTYTRFRDLENAEYQNKIIQAENERKSEELEEARQLQLSMLPKDLPQLPNLDIAVYMQTATEVGGDYYDFHVGDDGELTTVIGDATGHGLKAGTVVTITKSLFNNLGSEEDVLKSFSKISRVIKDMNFPQLSMCLQMLKIKGNKLVLTSAAMPPVLIYRKNKRIVEEVSINGMPLGAIANFPYKIQETKLNKGDIIFMMSDGYPELMNDKGRMFGYERVKNKFRSIAEETPEEIINSLKNSASKWANGKDPDDDVTFVVIKVK